MWEDPTHVKLYPVGALKGLAKQYNFNIVRVFKYGPRTNPVKVIANIILGMSIYTGITLVFERV